jgi:hypothetical protein
MESLKIKREVVALVMESPLYFTVPLHRRLQFIKFFSQQPVFNAICDPPINHAVRTDHLKRPERALVKFPTDSIGVRSLVPYFPRISWRSPWL